MEIEGRYRQLFDALPIPVVISRAADNTLVYANPRLLGFVHAASLSTLIGHDITEWLHPDSRTKAARNVAAIVSGEGPIDDTRYRLVLADGNSADVDIYAIPTEFEGEPAMFSFMLDATEIEQAEAGRLAAEERYEMLVDALPVGVAITRLTDGVVVYANRACRHGMLLERPGQLTGRPLTDFIHPDDLARASRNMASLIAGRGRPRDARYRFVRGDGTIAVVDVHSIPTQVDGEAALLSILIDRTEHEESRISLEAAEGRYRTLVETSPDGIFVHRDRRFLFANPAAARMFGARAPSELVGLEILDLVAPESLAEVTERVRILYQERTSPPPSVITARRLDRTEFAAEVRTTPIVYEGEPAAQTFVRDLSDLESAERAARQAASRARAIVASMPLGLYSYRLMDDGRLVLTDANPAADHIAGIEHGGLIGLTIEEAFPGLVGTGVPEAYKEVARTGVSWESERMHYSEEGRLDGYFDVHAFRTEPNAITVAFDDVTERRRTEAELAESRTGLERAVEERTAELTETNRALQEATHAKSSFLASMSHELRTPLNSIIGFSGILLQGIAGRLTEEQQRQVTMINRSGRQLLSLVGDILDLEKIEAGRIELMVDEFDLPLFIETIADTVRPLACEKGLELEVDISGAPLRMVGDRERLEQVLLNLLSNAIRYTETGSVSLIVTGRPDSSVAFAVKDTGVGIEEREHDRIFEAFHQLPARGVAKNVGTGLGLSISRHLATLMGGTIELHSEVGVGSVFTLVVPGG